MLRRTTKFLKSGEILWCLCRTNLHSNSSKVLFAIRDKDLPNPFLPTPLKKGLTHETDILLEQLHQARDLERVLELSSMHMEVMNAKHVICALDKVYVMAKEDKSIASRLLIDKTFQGLCTQLMRVVRVLEPTEVIAAYKCMTVLGIRNNTYVMQSLLKMIGSSLNDMTLPQLVFVNFLLGRQKTNSMVEGLKLAVPLVLQVQIEQQLDSENLGNVIDCLHVAARARLKPATIQKVLSVILDKAKMLNTAHAVTAIFALLNINAPMDGYKELLNYCFEVITKDIESMSIKQIQGLLRVCRVNSFYQGKFFFAVANHVVSNKWSLNDTFETLRELHDLNFSPDNLKDHFARAICREPEELKIKDHRLIFDCAKYLVATGYRAESTEEVLDILCSCHEKIVALEHRVPNLFLRLVCSLAMMGKFPQHLMSQVLDEENLFQSWHNSKQYGKSLDFETSMLSLVCSLEVYDQKHNFQLPASFLKKLIHAAHERTVNYEYPLEKFIEHGLGGNQFLQNGVYTHDGIFIDHVLSMRSGNYPVALQSVNASAPDKQHLFIEDFVFPHEAKIITIIVARGHQYVRDPEVLTGWMDIRVRALSKKKYSPVVINFNQWNNLPDREKIPFLMREIKLSVQDENSEKSNLFS